MPVAYDFHGRIAIVTGGARGIGRSIAERLRDAGADVAVWDIREPDFAGVSFTLVDVSQAASIERGLAAILERHRTIDILVNNAGFVGSSTPVLEFAPSEWRRSIEVNLISFFEVCRLVVPVMVQSGYGRVVNMASIAGKDGSPNRSAYAAAKAGVIAFTKCLAKEIALSNVRVNAIAPATIDTEILRQLTPDDVRSLIDMSPMKRLGTVEEVAALALWLCSEDCSFSTGATFDLSGGRAVY
jgi:2-dehydro-3-deoxy-L-rhamnonate dehydrogenase (NAD+)